MTEFPSEAVFKYSWRKYQERVLEELNDHLNDKHLHVIAPPGSGKTILGLEVMLRLNKPTLILAPTIAIRNQWVQRFCELFLGINSIPEWISFDIRSPQFLTVVTYQGLHAACNDLMEEESEIEEETEERNFVKSSNSNLDKIIAGLESVNIQTIVVDEAHHLKNEWWTTLTKVKKRLNASIIGLTATPPYDVSVSEWQRYLDLNGPVDAEISVPELVVEGDLCPHQDYVYFNLPTEEESQKIVQFRQRVENQYHEIKNDRIIIQALENHRIWLEPMKNLEWIYENVSYYSATLIFLHANGRLVPETHLEILSDEELKIPALDYSWTETLLDFYLFSNDEQFVSLEEHRKQLEDRLRRFGVLERKRVNFKTNPKITGALNASLGKLNSIREIVDFESNQLGAELRMVILSDYIRKEFFVDTSENKEEINKLGVIPIFEKLRREKDKTVKLGVLTGTLVIIPRSACPELEKLATISGIDKVDIVPVAFDPDYCQVIQTERVKNHLVHLVTQIFQQGEIEVLIGTKSLLGEGWDAPAINSLILASFVGSFVLSNQMRGRAIRRQHSNPEKTGNIWHLITIDTSSGNGGDDLELLKRRFKGFVGVSFKNDPVIENGIGRLNLPDDFSNKQALIDRNNETKMVASDRESLKKRWKTALSSGAVLIEEIKIPFSHEKGKSYEEVQSLYLTKTIASLIASLGAGVLMYLNVVLQGFSRSVRHIRTLYDLYVALMIIGILGIIIFGRLTFKTLRMYLKYRDISKDIQRIGEALLNALIESGIINTSHSELKVVAVKNKYGGVYCHLSGGTTFEKSTFIQALNELVVPVNNPRYVIERRSNLVGVMQQIDYHSVPDILAKNKSQAEFFETQWKQQVGSCYLIFTRTKEGRKLLLRARLKSLSAQMNEVDPEHVNKWV